MAGDGEALACWGLTASGCGVSVWAHAPRLLRGSLQKVLAPYFPTAAKHSQEPQRVASVPGPGQLLASPTDRQPVSLTEVGWV